MRENESVLSDLHYVEDLIFLGHMYHFSSAHPSEDLEASGGLYGLNLGS